MRTAVVILFALVGIVMTSISVSYGDWIYPLCSSLAVMLIFSIIGPDVLQLIGKRNSRNKTWKHMKYKLIVWLITSLNFVALVIFYLDISVYGLLGGGFLALSVNIFLLSYCRICADDD